MEGLLKGLARVAANEGVAALKSLLNCACGSAGWQIAACGSMKGCCCEQPRSNGRPSSDTATMPVPELGGWTAHRRAAQASGERSSVAGTFTLSKFAEPYDEQHRHNP